MRMEDGKWQNFRRGLWNEKGRIQATDAGRKGRDILHQRGDSKKPDIR